MTALQTLPTELSEKEIADIDMRVMAKVLFDRTITLSTTVNEELLRPMSVWLDDPDFMEKHKIIIEENAPDWASYKRQQREFSALQIKLATERLAAYREAVRQKKAYTEELRTILAKSSESQTDNDFHRFASRRNGCGEADDPEEPFTASAVTAISNLTMMFSHRALDQREADIAFLEIDEIPETIIPDLPVKPYLIARLKNEPHICLQSLANDLPHIKRHAMTQMLVQGLFMANDGELELNQTEPFGEIIIKATNKTPTSTNIVIKDRNGNQLMKDFATELTESQRNKIMTDTMNKKIICKVI